MRALPIAIAMLLPPPAVAQTAPDGAAEPAPADDRSKGTLVIDSAAGLQVRIDDEVIGSTPLPGPWTLEPGEHVVELRPATGAPTVRNITVAAGQRVTLELRGPEPADPAPQSAKPAPKPAAPVPDEALAEAPPPAGPGFSLATGGYVAAGLGLAGVGAGVFLGLTADGHAADARDLDRASHDRRDLQDLVDQADSAAFWANVSYGAGGVLLLGGAAMILLATDGPLGIAPTPGGAMIEGRF